MRYELIQDQGIARSIFIGKSLTQECDALSTVETIAVTILEPFAVVPAV